MAKLLIGQLPENKKKSLSDSKDKVQDAEENLISIIDAAEVVFKDALLSDVGSRRKLSVAQDALSANAALLSSEEPAAVEVEFSVADETSHQATLRKLTASSFFSDASGFDIAEFGVFDESTIVIQECIYKPASDQTTPSAIVTCSGSCPCPSSSAQSSGSFSEGSDNYDNNEDCRWLISSTANAEIELSFSSFNTESGYDYVTINQCASASCSSPEQLARLSGDSVISAQKYVSSTGWLQVRFQSDGSVTRSGFEARWNVKGQQGDVFEPETCTVVFTGAPVKQDIRLVLTATAFDTEGERNQVIEAVATTSNLGSAFATAASATVACSGSCPCPSSSAQSSGSFSEGSGDYDNDEDCRWLISSTADTEIELSFSSFNTESGYDYVTINRCSSASCSSPEQLVKLSGDSVGSSDKYTSSTGFLQVRFTSDSSQTRSGFSAQWSVRSASSRSSTCFQTDMSLHIITQEIKSKLPERLSVATLNDALFHAQNSRRRDANTDGTMTTPEGASVRAQAQRNGEDKQVVATRRSLGDIISVELCESQCGGCPPGSVASMEGCTNCQSGKYWDQQDTASSGICLSCPAGKYSTIVGATSISSCMFCPEYASSPAGSSSLSDCSQCDVGQTPDPNHGACSACVAGKFKSSVGNILDGA